MIYLKNISDVSRNPVTIDINLLEHPMTKKIEWSELPKNPITGEVDKMKAKMFPQEDQSKVYEVVIKPGEMAVFGGKERLNEEHAEYLYMTYGSPERADTYGAKNKNWLIEVDKDGKEVRGHLFDKYRGVEMLSDRAPIVVAVQAKE